MYSPSAFSVTDASVILDFIRKNGFGIVISRDENGLHDTHTPLMISGDLKCVSGHIARANPQWRTWEKQPDVKVIFHGPHAYISPGYYRSEFNVPTWNYSAVSIDGKLRIIKDRERQVELIRELTSQYEGESGWRLDTNDDRYMKLFDAVVCFSIEVERIEAKFKLNQNKSEEDQLSVIAHLQASQSGPDRETAELMLRTRDFAGGKSG